MEAGSGLVLATERYGREESWKYLAQDGVMRRRRDGREGEGRGNSIAGVFKSVFLPQGFPESVSGDYLHYQFWDTMQAFSSSLSGTLATQASLKGVGVGNQEATVAAATVTWLLRDGTGMLGRILFAWQKGTKLDSEAKKWRLFADVLNDIAMFMEILAPFFPAFFTLIVCTAGTKMAAATAAGLDAHRLEEKKLEYFSSISSMASKIMQEREKIKNKHGSAWDKMTPQEQDSAIDGWMMDPHIRARYAAHRQEREEVVCYPKLLLQTGQKMVHFGEEDITWQDEHSAPFSWETRSQLEFSLTSGTSDQLISTSQADSKAAKVPHPSQVGKNTAGTKVSVSESRRLEEESSFWKISAERSRLEGEQAEFQSLTPSQIKSLEKGEKSLPSYLRQETSVTTKDPEPMDPPPPAPTRSTKQRAPKPPAPQPPVPVHVPAPVAVSATPASISITPSPAPPVSVSSSVAGWERSQSTLPSAGNAHEEMFSSGMMAKSPKLPAVAVEKEKEEEAAPNSPTFSQFNTSSNILKTGFDFLDNW